MPSDVKPPTQAEIEEAIKKSHLAGTPPRLTAPVNPENSEIGTALAEFEKQQGGIAVPLPNQTVDVMRSQRIEIPQDSEPSSKMVKRVMKLSGGAIKNQQQAEYVLLILAIIMFGVSMYFFFGGPGGGSGDANVFPPMMMSQPGTGFPGSP